METTEKSFGKTLEELTVGTGTDMVGSTFLKQKLHELLNYFNKNEAYDSFERNLMILKSVFFLMIIVMSIYYPLKFKTVGLIKSKPLTMIGESAVFATSTVIPFMMLVLLRNKKFTTQEIIKYIILIFIIFFCLNYLLELSGVYSYTFQQKQTDKLLNADLPTKDTKLTETHPILLEFNSGCTNPNNSPGDKLLKTIDFSTRTFFLAFIGIIVVMLIAVTFFIHDTTIDYNIKSINKWIIFFFESLIFGAVSAVPIYLIAKNRNALNPLGTSEDFLIIVAKFFVLNVVLQFSGFYNHLFVKDYEY